MIGASYSRNHCRKIGKRSFARFVMKFAKKQRESNEVLDECEKKSVDIVAYSASMTQNVVLIAFNDVSRAATS